MAVWRTLPSCPCGPSIHALSSPSPDGPRGAVRAVRSPPEQLYIIHKWRSTRCRDDRAAPARSQGTAPNSAESHAQAPVIRDTVHDVFVAALNSSMPPTRAGAVVAELRRLIQSGEIPPGAHLRQVEVAKRFNVSTTPVREAFVALAREGLVRQDSHRGVVVFEPSLDELNETYRIREQLEPWATELACKRLTAEDLGALADIVTEMRTAEPARYAELNREFHGRIYAGAGMPRLQAIIDGLRSTATSYVGMTVTQYEPSYREQVHAEHEEILRLLQERSAKPAGRAIRDHLRNNARHVASLIPSQP